MSMKAHLELAQVCDRARQLLNMIICTCQESVAYVESKCSGEALSLGNLLF